MSAGAGRLERAILKVDFGRYYKGGFCISTEEICRAVYPVATLIEKKHRVAVLQAIHRIMRNPPRPTEDRNWSIRQGPKRGYWEKFFLADSPQGITNDKLTAYHEAGHALACLYFGCPLDQVVLATWRLVDQQVRAIERAQKRGTPAPDLLGGFVRPVVYCRGILDDRSAMGETVALLAVDESRRGDS